MHGEVVADGVVFEVDGQFAEALADFWHTLEVCEAKDFLRTFYGAQPGA